MKVLLRNVDTGLLYAGPEKWTADYAEAKDFEQTDRAIDAALEARFTGVEVLMHFEDPYFQIPLQIISAESEKPAPEIAAGSGELIGMGNPNRA